MCKKKYYSMEKELFFPEDSILFVGEGNFSFSLSFIKLKYCVQHITATCFESEVKSEETLKNMTDLKNRDAHVLSGIDATKLTSYSDLTMQNFTCIIFNFPHIGGKMKINRNRKLLKDYFTSATLLLAKRNKQTAPPRIIVSLCKGQGGTPADGDALRVWGDSWQVVEMAAASGLLLTKVEPFNHQLCVGYTSVGYRSKDIWFHTEKALVHVFEPCVPLFVTPQLSPSESLVSINTCCGLVACQRLYLEMAQFKEIDPDHFIQELREKSVVEFLFLNLKSVIESKFNNIEFVPPCEIPLHCDTSSSNVSCVLENETLSFLRSDISEVIGCKKNLLSYGPVFQRVSKNFNVSPVHHQAVICYPDINEVLLVIQNWISNLIRETDIQNKCTYIQTLPSLDKIITPQSGSCITIDLSALACLVYKLHGFRDLLVAQHTTTNACKVVSLYPRTHTLDICFVETPQFQEDDLVLVLWQYFGYLIINLELFDQYKPENENWKSRGYRIQYRSSKEAMSRQAAVTLHQNGVANIFLTSQLAAKVL